ncbi:MAG TPA: response regulator [Candidatus Binatia bacterium]|nr:response regulator [Candidatus Binatia bacterium]
MKKKILIVDDDTKLSRALGIRLSDAGYKVLAANDAPEGLKIALESRPDLIILDIWMPGGVGLLLAERLKNLGLAETPVILLTASAKEKVWHIAQEIEPAAFFEKPYNPKQLLSTIDRLLPRLPPETLLTSATRASRAQIHL